MEEKNRGNQKSFTVRQPRSQWLQSAKEMWRKYHEGTSDDTGRGD